jgi:hypothetical protein
MIKKSLEILLSDIRYFMNFGLNFFILLQKWTIVVNSRQLRRS